MNDKIYNENIDRLNISCKTIDILKQNQITTLKQLCQKMKNDLKKYNLTNSEINKIDVELQLLGLSLKYHN